MLRQIGWHVDLVYTDISMANWRNLMRPHTSTDHVGINVNRTSSHWSLPRNNRLGMLLWLKIYCTQVKRYLSEYDMPDIIHAHTYLGGWVAAQIKHHFNIPYIITEHATAVQRNDLSSVHQEILTTAYTQTNRIIAVSKQLQSTIAQRFPNVQVVPNFIDTNLFQLGHHDKTDSFNIIYVGDLITRKQVHLLIEACSKLSLPYQLTIVGDGPLSTNLEDLAKSLGVHARFLGRQSQTGIAELLVNQHLMVHPSQTETFGLVLVEAMSCGVPVVAFDNGGARDIITIETGLIVAGPSSSNLVEAIQKIYDNIDLYKPDTIRQYAIDHFSVWAISNRLWDIYKEVLENNHQ